MSINYKQAAARYAVMAQQNLHADNCIRAAHCFLQASDYAAAAEWFAQASILFTNQGNIEQGLHALQSYQQLKPNDRVLAYNILQLCQKFGQAPQILLRILSNREEIELAIHSMPIFAAINEQQCNELIGHMRQRHYESGDIVVSMGATASSLFFVMDGELNVTLPMTGTNKQLATLSAGDMFGEMGYFLNEKRTATVEACSNVTLLELPYSAVDILQKEIPNLKKVMLHDYRQHVQITRLLLTPMFADLAVNDIASLAQHANLLRVHPGEVLFQEGDTTKGVYLICHGNLALSTSVQDDEHVVAILGAGDLAGEIALVPTGKHTTTARSVIDCTVLILDSLALQNVYQHSPKFRDLLKKRKKKKLHHSTHRVTKENSPLLWRRTPELQNDWSNATRNGLHTLDIADIQHSAIVYH